MSDHQDMPEPAGADADTPLEPWLQALASSYHRPPPAPREAMWARIQAARAGDHGDPGHAGDAGAEGAAVVVAAAGSVHAAELATGDDLARRRARRGGNAAGNGRGPNAWAGPSLGLAAALLLAAGLGWWTRTPAIPSAAPAGAPAAVAVVPAEGAPSSVEPSSVEPSSARSSGSGRTTVAAGAGPVAAPRAATAARRPPPAGDARATTARLAVATDGGRDVGAAAVGSDAADSPYRLAAVQHLGQAEALLTVFRAGYTRDAADPSLQPWARELLTTTRLLLDSPAGRDPRLGALLGELEPVLVQIVQLPAARAAEERLLIARSIERSDLMTQLRSAVPAGPAVPQRAGE